MLARRNVLKLLGLAPTAPLAAKLAHDAEVADKVGGLRGWPVGGKPPSGVVSIGGNGVDGPFSGYAPEFRHPGPTYDQFRAMLGGKEFRDNITSLLFEQERRNHPYLDPDIAIYKSWSISAKIAFQRQRNVERELQSYLQRGPWSRLREAVNKHPLLSMLGL